MAKEFGWKKVSRVCGDGVIRETDEVYSLDKGSYESAVVPNIPSLPINHSSTIVLKTDSGKELKANYKNGKIVSVSE